MDLNEMKHDADIQEETVKNGFSFDNFIGEIKRQLNDVKDGYKAPFQVAINLRSYIDRLTELQDECNELVLLEIKSEPINYAGFKFEKIQSGRYDYSESSEWSDLSNRIKSLEKDMQIAYKKGAALINESTGEVIMPANYKPNKESFKITKSH